MNYETRQKIIIKERHEYEEHSGEHHLNGVVQRKNALESKRPGKNPECQAEIPSLTAGFYADSLNPESFKTHDKEGHEPQNLCEIRPEKLFPFNHYSNN